MPKRNKPDREKAELARQEAEVAMKDALTAKWREEDARLERYVAMAKGFRGTDPSTIRAVNFDLHHGELIFGGFRGDLIEIPPAANPSERRSHGGATPIARDVRYRIAATRGHYAQAPNAPRVLDSGAVTVTNRRLVFQGPKAAREWTLANLSGHLHHDRWPWSCIQVSDHQVPLGVATAPEQTADFRFAFELALAIHDGTTEALATEFEQELADHRAAGPTIPPL